MKLKIDEIELDEGKIYYIYPRKKVVKGEITISLNQKTIDSYVEALKAGAKFPPVEVQKVLMDGEEKTIPLDGVHRLKAIKQYNKEISKKEGTEEELDEERQESYEKIEEIEVTFWKDEVLDYEENKTSLLMRATFLNIEHGDRLSMDNKEILAKGLTDVYLVNYGERKGGGEKEQQNGSELDEMIDGSLSNREFRQELAKYLCVSERTIYEWVLDKFRTLTNRRDLLIYKLHMLGWAQDGIKDAVVRAGYEQKYSQMAVSKVLKLFAKLQKVLISQFESDKPIQDIVKENEKYYGLDETLAWAIVLQGKSDRERFDEIGIKLKPYDVWNFSECHNLLGQDHPGRIPGQLVINFVYYATKPNDLVVDFMSGGGVTNDACLLMGRKCYSYDINPKRNDIMEHDLINDGKVLMPDLKKKPKCIFVDPPYWSMNEEKYGSGFSDVTLDEFYNRIEQFAKQCYDLLDNNGVFGFLIQNQTGRDVKKGEAFDKEAVITHTHICTNIFEKIGFKLVRVVNCPQGTQQDQPQEVDKVKDEKRMLGIVRDLLVFRK